MVGSKQTFSQSVSHHATVSKVSSAPLARSKQVKNTHSLGYSIGLAPPMGFTGDGRNPKPMGFSPRSQA